MVVRLSIKTEGSNVVSGIPLVVVITVLVVGIVVVAVVVVTVFVDGVVILVRFVVVVFLVTADADVTEEKKALKYLDIFDNQSVQRGSNLQTMCTCRTE